MNTIYLEQPNCADHDPLFAEARRRWRSRASWTASGKRRCCMPLPGRPATAGLGSGLRTRKSRPLAVDVALSLDTRPEVATSAPYVASGQTTDPRAMQVSVLLYAPTGGRIENVMIEGAEPGVTSQVHGGLTVVGKTVTLTATSSASLSYRIISETDFEGPVMLRKTPLTRATARVEETESCRS